MQNEQLPIAVIGAGPVGLAAAAHLIERNQEVVIFEMADHVAGNMSSWSHVRVFSRWAENIDAASRRLLEADGWIAPDPDGLPTGGEIIGLYLEPLGKHPEIAPRLHLGTKVIAVSRKNIDLMKNAGREDAPFVVTVETADGKQRRVEARAVVDASGTWATPNPVGAGGTLATGEKAAADHIFYGIPDVLGRMRARYSARRTMVVGSGHSAFQALIDLSKLSAAEPGTKVFWSLRSAPTVATFGGGDADELPARGALGQILRGLVDDGTITVISGNRIETIEVTDDGLHVRNDAGETHVVDEIIAVTGSRPDYEIIRELRVEIDPVTEAVKGIAEHIDPNFHSCGSVPPHGEADLRQPEPGFYVVGNKSYGRAPTFLMMTGYEQVRSVAAGLAGDMESAARVELTLPETGVCLGSDSAIYNIGGENSAACAIDESGCC